MLDLVVCETSQGLRLCSQEVLVAEDPEQTVDRLEELVDRAIEKYGESVTRLWAVPPLLSDDPVHDPGYLKQAYARLIAQTLLNQPGSLVVELDEARAVDGEIELAAWKRRTRAACQVASWADIATTTEATITACGSS